MGWDLLFYGLIGLGFVFVIINSARARRAARGRDAGTSVEHDASGGSGE